MAIPPPKPTSILAASLESWEYLNSLANVDLQIYARGKEGVTAVAAHSAFAATHYTNFGKGEGRSITFDAAEYLASNIDLIKAFNPQKLGSSFLDAELLASQHYFNYGFAESRSGVTDTANWAGEFNPVTYLQTNADIAAFIGYVSGTPTDDQIAFAQLHFVTYGFYEARSGSGLTAATTTFALTTARDAAGVGAFAAGSPTSNAIVYGYWNNDTSTTFNAGDNITASGTGNTFNLSDGGSNGTTTLNIAGTVSGMQTLVINSGETVVFNAKTAAAGYTGLTQLTATTASVGKLATAAPTTITAAATTNVTVTDKAVDNGSAVTGAGVTVLGGKNISVTESGSTASASAVTVGGSAATDPAGTVTVNVTGTGNTTVTTNGGTSNTITTSQTGNVIVGTTDAPTGAVSVTTSVARGTTVGAGTAGSILIGGGTSATVSETAYIGNTVGISGATGANTVTLSSTSVGGASAITIDAGTTATVNTTGGNVTIAATTLPSGAISVTDTNTLGASVGALNADIILVDGVSGVGAGTVNITTAATSGNVYVGEQTPTAAKGVAGNVTIVNKTTNGANTFYGSSATKVYTAGATSVSITGAGTTAIADELATNVLSTISLTGVGGTATIGSTALSKLTVANSALVNAFGSTQLATTALLTTLADGTLEVDLSNTKSGTTVRANNAKVVNVVASGSSTTSLDLTQTLAPATTGKSLSITNNATAAFTLASLDNTSVGTGYTITTAGSGNIALGNLTHAAYAGAADTFTGTETKTITSGSTGTLSVVIDGATTTFQGGSSVNTVTVKSGGVGNITKVINGGTSGNNTVVFGEAYTNYTAAPGAGISNFQNVTLASGATGTYDVTAFTGTAKVSGATAPVVFSNTLSAQALNIASAAVGTSAVTVASSAGAGTGTAIINGVSVSFTVHATAPITTAGNISTAINAASIPGVYATVFGAVVTISGATVLGNIDKGTGTATFTTTAGTGATELLNPSSFTVGDTLATITGINTLPVSIGTATSGAQVVSLNEANQTTINVTGVQAAGNVANTLNILDTTTTAQANGATSITVASGSGRLNLNYNVNTATGTNTLASLSATGSTGALDVTGVVFRTSGTVAITGGSGALTAFGSGVLANATGTGYLNAVETITTGSGGGTITLGYAGAAGGTGSTTLALGNSTGVSDTVAIAPYATNGVRATVSGFTTGVTNSDVLRITTATQTNTSGQFSFGTALGQVALTTQAVAQSTVAYGGSDTYTVSNGMIIFTGGDTYAQKLISAKGIVNAAGANALSAFVYSGNTYVVGSGASTTVGNDDVVVTLSNLSATQIGGLTGADNAIIFDYDTCNASTGTGASKFITNVAAAATDATGYWNVDISGAGTATQTISNLAQSAFITDKSTGNYSLTTGQVGTAGHNSLVVTLMNAHTIPVLTAVGDAALTIFSNAASVVTSLVDSGNTLSTLTLNQGSALRLDGITDTALATIHILNTSTTALGLLAAPISQAGLRVNIGSATVDPGVATVYVSGANDVVSVLNTADASTHTISATGAGSIVNVGQGVQTVTVGDNGTVNFQNTVAASAGVNGTTGNSAPNIVTVGANSTVSLGYTVATGASLGGASQIIVTGDTAGTSHSNFTTISHITDGGTLLQFSAASTGADVTAGQVNVASANTLDAALDLAAYKANLSGSTSGTHYVDFFRFAGDTYVVDHIGTGTAATALVAADIVVKVVGLPAFSIADDGLAGTGILL